MRDLNKLNAFRLVVPLLGPGDHKNGAFGFHRDDGSYLRVIATDHAGWDHVSVSLVHRCPTWSEMDWIKRKFFEDYEVVLQYHVPSSDHVNCHPFCLHLWRPQNVTIPRPPKELVL